MEGGVEAGDRWHAGQHRRDGGERVERFRLVKRSELRELVERGDDRSVEEDRALEALAAVDDPVRDDVGVAELTRERLGELVRRRAATRGSASSRAASDSSSPPSSESLTLLDPALTASTRIGSGRTPPSVRRAAVSGHFQSRTSGGSSPTSRV